MERVAVTLANAWSAHGHRVTFILMNPLPSFYELDERVTVVYLGRTDGCTGARLVLERLGRFARMRGTIIRVNPDVLISHNSIWNVLVLLATIGLTVPIIVTEHSDPIVQRTGWMQQALRQFLYPRAERVAFLTDEARQQMAPRIRRHSVVIPNPVSVEYKSSSVQGQNRQVIGMGRFTREKGFDLLISAFAALTSIHPEWNLVIYGDGPLRNELAAQVESLGLADRVRLPGRTKTPGEAMRAADIFVLASRREGFGMVLCEAMACGVPVVSFDCPSGPRTIIRDGIDGILVPPQDVASLTAVLDRLIRSPDERARLGAAAPAVLERFGTPAVIHAWDLLLDDIVRTRRTARG